MAEQDATPDPQETAPRLEERSKREGIVLDEVDDRVRRLQRMPGFYDHDQLGQAVIAYEPYYRGGWEINISRPKFLAAPQQRARQPKYFLGVMHNEGRGMTAAIMRNGTLLDPDTKEPIVDTGLAIIEEALDL